MEFGIMNIRKILILSIFLLSVNLFGADLRFSHIGSVHGLPNQQVESLVEDNDGNIWIATRNGLCRYDGYEILTYYHQAEDPSTIGSSFIHALHVDIEGRLWASTEAGISMFRSASNDFRNYHTNGVCKYIAEDKEGRIIIGGACLYEYDAKVDSLRRIDKLGDGEVISLLFDDECRLLVGRRGSIVHYDRDLSNPSVLDPVFYEKFMKGSDVIMPMFFDSSKRLWIGRNGNGVECINFRTGEMKIYPLKEIPNGIIRVISEDELNRIWLGTEKGICIISADGRTEFLQHNPYDEGSLSDNAIYSILFDSNWNVWVGSYFGGVDYILKNNSQFGFFRIGNGENGFKARVARMMAEEKDGRYWIATEDGGINIYDFYTGKFSVFDGIPGMGTNIHSLYYDKNADEMWIGTRFDGLFRYNLRTKSSKHYYLNKGLNSEGIFYLLRLNDGKLCVATMRGLRIYDEVTDYFYEIGHEALDNIFIYSLFADPDGKSIWACTATEGFFRIEYPGMNIRHFPASKQTGLKDPYVICVFKDSGGTLWVGTNGNGLQFMDSGTGRLESLDDEALSRSSICSIVEDSDKHLWIGTGNGLFRHDLNDKSVTRFSSENGLPVNQFNFCSSMVTASGEIFLGTISGLIAFWPDSIRPMTGPFNVHLKSLTIDNDLITSATDKSPLTRELNSTASISLSFAQAKSFNIDFGVIKPGSTGSISYQMFLDGVDDDWRNVGNEHHFYGYNMRPGKYVLNVRANNTNSDWENCPVKSLRIRVMPPFYKSAWAYLFYASIILLLMYLSYFVLKERNEVKLANMEKEKIKELDAAKSDFFATVSHELKTPLTLISAPLKSIRNENMDRESATNLDLAIKSTKQMEGLINQLVTMNKLETNSFPLNIQKGNPMDFIELYSESFRQAAKDKSIELSVSCENNGEYVWFSPSFLERIINNLLSNAIKFTMEGGLVSVKADITTEMGYSYLNIAVSDTGIGISKEDKKHIFERYYQTRPGFGEDKIGWGIGLSLVKSLVMIHKGTVSVDSELGKGSTFKVSLNVSQNAFGSECEVSGIDSLVSSDDYKVVGNETESGIESFEPEEEKHTLLLVDDNEDMLKFLANYLKGRFNILTASNGQEAIMISKDTAVDMIISDVMMPIMNGVELCSRLKNDMATSHIPVILLTAKSDPVDVAVGYKSGADSYVVKPFDPQTLEFQVNNILQLISVRQQEIVNSKNDEYEISSLTDLDKDFLQRINNIVDANIDNSEFSVSEITSELGISRSMLYMKMKSLMNISVGDFIRKRRIDTACVLLAKGHNVSETAYMTGFSDPNYFSKVFKKAKGVSPSDYMQEK